MRTKRGWSGPTVIRIPYSAPTGFMVPPLHDVSSAVSCSGTLDQGSLFRFRVHSNYSVVVVIWTFVVRAIYTCPVIGVRCCKAWDIHPVLKNVFFLFRFSFRNTSHLSPFPFSATTQVMNNHTRPRQNLTGKLYFVCKHCWIYLLHVSTLHEPCRGCAMMESIGWEFWTPGRGRSAWWRHPCWMFILIFFFVQLDSKWIIQRVMIFKSWPIPHKLCIVNHQGWSSLLHLFKPNR